MKKKTIFIISILLIINGLIFNNKINTNKEHKNVEIKTYIDGKLATSLPSSNEGYKVSEITCTNGATGTFNYSTWRLITSNVTGNTTCEISFVSNTNTEFVTYLKNKACSTTPTSDSAAKDCLVNENGYRYEGTNPNNYVLFNDEIWQIIGVFTVMNRDGVTQDLIKLIRNDVLDSLAWDGENTNNWSVATLQKALNTGYLNKEDIDCNVNSSTKKSCKFSKTGINKTARNMIESIKWNLGGISSNSTDQNYYLASVDKYYSFERGNIVSSGVPTTWTGKVALMYPSDYGYSVLASSCVRSTNLYYYYSTTACAGNSWLYKGEYEWTLMHNSSSTTYVSRLISSGYLHFIGDTKGAHNVRPTIHLKSNVKYMSGTGTYDDPYIISL